MVTEKTILIAVHIGVGKKYSKAQWSFPGPGVCLLAVMGLFGKTCPLPSAILEQLPNIFVEDLMFGRWRLANELWASLKEKSLKLCVCYRRNKVV